MQFPTKQSYTKNEATVWPIPNYWDFIAVIIVFALIIMLFWGAKQMAVSYNIGDNIPIVLNPAYLPMYALRTILRIFLALICSLIFTLVVGTVAAKNRHAERLIIPIIDVLQSVPILSFLSITILGFIAMFPGRMLGPECASIFVIFTSQVWNMTLSFYQGMKIVPHELIEVADVFHLSAWQRFWRVQVPFTMPGLLWNMMMSMSGSWFFVTAAEAISIADQNITLPGIGSYIALAITHADINAIIYAIIMMLIVIILYDQFLFRPLIYWTERFKDADDDGQGTRPWVVSLFQRTKLLRYCSQWLGYLVNKFVNLPILRRRLPKAYHQETTGRITSYITWIYYLTVTVVFVSAVLIIGRFIFATVTLREVGRVVQLGLCTGARVMILIAISSLIWLPIGVWIGLRPRVTTIIQPIVQFLAAFPANLLFPVVAMLVVKYKFNVEIWVAPLMVLGTQWYILFNVIAGASMLPKDLRLAAANFRVKGWLWWRRLIFPGIAPYFITGAITAAGGAWNASIVAEVISWGNIRLEATGLGAYIQQYSMAHDFARIVLGTITMCLIVLLVNRIFWRPLYNLVIAKFQWE